MLQIQIGAERTADAGDLLGRATLGWRPGMSEAEVWEVSRGIWKFNADRALSQDEVQIINTEGTVLAVAKITGISKHGDRYALEGDLLLGDPRVGRPTPSPHLSRNPVTYI
ncbi:hypothetical protein OG453_44135 [Streptomyces sp. NBC_01381]|uniref:hypothetical protein n=1 Tax=Streptomyces sp. NBC_01381 TaxID=2903845 RepID=UPI00225BD441|nr:hypothetical protein [Streptomyces sp. NBC_01381]MCX4673549.1 hypothetical protein [Streptomyces sp. NBC_01381]